MEFSFVKIKRLSTWKGWWLSFGRRITLLKSVLGSFAIFTLSFYKDLRKVIRENSKQFSMGKIRRKKDDSVGELEDCLPSD